MWVIVKVLGRLTIETTTFVTVNQVFEDRIRVEMNGGLAEGVSPLRDSLATHTEGCADLGSRLVGPEHVDQHLEFVLAVFGNDVVGDGSRVSFFGSHAYILRQQASSVKSLWHRKCRKPPEVLPLGARYVMGTIRLPSPGIAHHLVVIPDDFDDRPEACGGHDRGDFVFIDDYIAGSDVAVLV